jgi:hypothetical protein
VLSSDVEAVLGLAGAAWAVAAPAGMEAVTVPDWVMPDTDRLNTDGPPVTTAVVAPAVPESTTSVWSNPSTGVLNVAVKSIGETLVGSDCAAPCSTVTDGTTPPSTTKSTESKAKPMAGSSTPVGSKPGRWVKFWYWPGRPWLPRSSMKFVMVHVLATAGAWNQTVDRVLLMSLIWPIAAKAETSVTLVPSGRFFTESGSSETIVSAVAAS